MYVHFTYASVNIILINMQCRNETFMLKSFKFGTPLFSRLIFEKLVAAVILITFLFIFFTLKYFLLSKKIVNYIRVTF